MRSFKSVIANKIGFAGLIAIDCLMPLDLNCNYMLVLCLKFCFKIAILFQNSNSESVGMLGFTEDCKDCLFP